MCLSILSPNLCQSLMDINMIQFQQRLVISVFIGALFVFFLCLLSVSMVLSQFSTVCSGSFN